MTTIFQGWLKSLRCRDKETDHLESYSNPSIFQLGINEIYETFCYSNLNPDDLNQELS